MVTRKCHHLPLINLELVHVLKKDKIFSLSKCKHRPKKAEKAKLGEQTGEEEKIGVLGRNIVLTKRKIFLIFAVWMLQDL